MKFALKALQFIAHGSYHVFLSRTLLPLLRNHAIKQECKPANQRIKETIKDDMQFVRKLVSV